MLLATTTLTGSAFLTGMLGLVEIGPVIVTSLFAGAFADRHDLVAEPQSEEEFRGVRDETDDPHPGGD